MACSSTLVCSPFLDSRGPGRAEVKHSKRRDQVKISLRVRSLPLAWYDTFDDSVTAHPALHLFALLFMSWLFMQILIG